MILYRFDRNMDIITIEKNDDNTHYWGNRPGFECFYYSDAVFFVDKPLDRLFNFSFSSKEVLIKWVWYEFKTQYLQYFRYCKSLKKTRLKYDPYHRVYSADASPPPTEYLELFEIFKKKYLPK
jgi:hypothetical protein